VDTSGARQLAPNISKGGYASRRPFGGKKKNARADLAGGRPNVKMLEESAERHVLRESGSAAGRIWPLRQNLSKRAAAGGLCGGRAASAREPAGQSEPPVVASSLTGLANQLLAPYYDKTAFHDL